MSRKLNHALQGAVRPGAYPAASPRRGADPGGAATDDPPPHRRPGEQPGDLAGLQARCEHVAPVEHRPQERPAQEHRRDAAASRLAQAGRPAAAISRLAWAAQPEEKAWPAPAGFGLSYSHWIPGRAAPGQRVFPVPGSLPGAGGFALA
jgi:hypothetical protein